MHIKWIISSAAALSLVALSARSNAQEAVPQQQQDPNAGYAQPPQDYGQQMGPQGYGQPGYGPQGGCEQPMPQPVCDTNPCAQPIIQPLCGMAPITFPAITVRPPQFGLATVPQPPIQVPVLLDQGGVDVGCPGEGPCAGGAMPYGQAPQGQPQGQPMPAQPAQPQH